MSKTEELMRKMEALINEQNAAITKLKGAVTWLGEMADICTYHDLHEVCSYCKCKRKPK